MAMMSVPDILKERKYPFILAFFLLLIFVTFILVSNSQSPLPVTSNLAQTGQFSSAPKPKTPPDSGSGISSNNVSAVAVNTPTVDASPPAGGGGDDDQAADVEWELCDGPMGGDYIPCLDNMKVIKALPSRKRMEHRERHCPDPSPRCLVPMPEGYKAPVSWPKSRDMVRSFVLWW